MNRRSTLSLTDFKIPMRSESQRTGNDDGFNTARQRRRFERSGRVLKCLSEFRDRLSRERLPLPHQNRGQTEHGTRASSRCSSVRKRIRVCVRIRRALPARAPAHLRHWHVGRERPAGRLRGRGCDSRAGSLTPLPCCDICAGALNGRHKTPPSPQAASAPTSAGPSSCSHTRAAIRRGRPSFSRAGRCQLRGQPRPEVASPSSAPSRGGYSNGLMMRTPSKSSNPGRSSE